MKLQTELFGSWMKDCMFADVDEMINFVLFCFYNIYLECVSYIFIASCLVSFEMQAISYSICFTVTILCLCCLFFSTIITTLYPRSFFTIFIMLVLCKNYFFFGSGDIPAV